MKATSDNLRQPQITFSNMASLREELEDREIKLLAPYAVKCRYSKGRRYKEDEHSFRTAYQRDRDRIIHSTAFRRLEYKTQVFVNHEGDYYRTRLTHSLEVSQIARSIAKALRLNENLVEALALAHDLGHTPFGHSGEEALNDLMKYEGGFNHNFQGLRVVDVLEERYPEFKGLNLTWEMREGIIKHSTTFDRGSFKWGNKKAWENQDRTIMSYFENIENYSIDELLPDSVPSLETQVVDIADEIAYDSHDLDDGLTSGLIRRKDLKKIPLWEKASKEVNKRYKNLSSQIEKYQIIRYLINLNVTDLVDNTKEIIKLNKVKDIEDIRSRNIRLVKFSQRLEEERMSLREFLMDNMYKHYRVIRMSDKAHRFIRALFDVYLEKPSQLPPRIRKRLNIDSTRRVVCDYIAGMTDRYALDEYKKLFEPYERV